VLLLQERGEGVPVLDHLRIWFGNYFIPVRVHVSQVSGAVSSVLAIKILIVTL
jgi:hypothetical protein